jgi:hypothetical protein
MRRIFCSLFVVTTTALVASGPVPVNASLHVLAAPPPPAPTRTLTGILYQRTFFRNCDCYPWVIEKNNNPSEMDISAVSAEAQALAGTRVKATGTWSTYQRGRQRIPYMIVTRLDPA